MRFILLVLAAALSLASPALAQPAPHPGAERLARIMLVETGMLEQVIEAVGKQLEPRLRQSFMQQPWYARLDAEKREQVDAFGETILDRTTAAIRQQTPEIEKAVAVAFSGHLTADESAGVADYFGSKVGLAVYEAITASALEELAAGSTPDPDKVLPALTPEQVASLEAFVQTSAGRAFSRISGERSRAISRDSVLSAMKQVSPTLVVELRRELCAILGEPCPLI